MKSIQQMDKIIAKADHLLDAWDDAFETKDWKATNIAKRELRQMIDEYYHKSNIKL